MRRLEIARANPYVQIFEIGKQTDKVDKDIRVNLPGFDRETVDPVSRIGMIP